MGGNSFLRRGIHVTVSSFLVACVSRAIHEKVSSRELNKKYHLCHIESIIYLLICRETSKHRLKETRQREKKFLLADLLAVLNIGGVVRVCRD